MVRLNEETGSLNFDEGPNLGRMRCSVAPVPAMMPIGGAEGWRIDGGNVSKGTRLLLSGRWPDATREPPSAEPHARWCGEGELNTPLYPLSDVQFACG